MHNKVKSLITTFLIGQLIPLLLESGVVSAAKDIQAVAIQLTVTIEAPTCTVNNNQVITVEFGEVVTTQVNGNHYRMPVHYTLDCKDAPSNAMKLQIEGNGASFDSTLLQTNHPALGIQIQQGSTKRPINTWLNFTYPKVPELWAVPVKQSSGILIAGEFTAAATMKVDYQ
ncbi:fimbrial protein [Serratia sp. NPDC078593]|uniref:fimbrial protein n=1 Tax=unclassified Serratia (in: enterobacteria) TaxID=2647522 RepID=UPI0037D0C081